MSKIFTLRLTCCGRDDGEYLTISYEDAELFRESYLDAGGHDRSAIIIEETIL